MLSFQLCFGETTLCVFGETSLFALLEKWLRFQFIKRQRKLEQNWNVNGTQTQWTCNRIMSILRSPHLIYATKYDVVSRNLWEWHEKWSKWRAKWWVHLREIGSRIIGTDVEQHVQHIQLGIWHMGAKSIIRKDFR